MHNFVPVHFSLLWYDKLEHFGGSETLTSGNTHGLTTERIHTTLISSIRCLQEKTQ